MKAISFIAFAFLISTVGLRAETHFLYVGGHGNREIQVFSFDDSDGSMTPVETEANGVRPWYMAATSDERFLYASYNNQGIAAFSIDESTGALTLIERQTPSGQNQIYVAVSPSNSLLVHPNYMSRDMMVYTVEANGSLTGPRQTLTFGSSARPHSSVFTSDGQFLFVPDLGQNKIWVFEVNENLDEPLLARPDLDVSTRAGSGPRHLVLSPNENFAYLSEEGSGFVSVYSHSNGALQEIQYLDTHAAGTSNRNSADIEITQDGRFLYISNRGDQNNIAVFSADPATGLLTFVEHQATGGVHPIAIDLDPSEKYVLCTNRDSNELVVFSRDLQDGSLTELSSTTISGAQSLLFPAPAITAASLYQEWVESYSLSGDDTLQSADPDGDSIKNLLEYAFGGNPAAADSAEELLPSSSVSKVSGETFLEVDYLRRKDAAGRGLLYTLEHTDDIELADWPEDAVVELGSTSVDDAFEEVQARINVPVEAPNPSRFAQVRVTLD